MTAMPLDESEASAVVQYLKMFSKRWLRDAPGLVVRPAQDFATSAKRLKQKSKEEWVAQGDKLYHSTAKCWSCHPAYETKENLYEWSQRQWADFPADLYQSKSSAAGYGARLVAPDFMLGVLRTGTSEEALYRVIASGVAGTSMRPAKDLLDEEGVWSVVYYVRSLLDLKEAGQSSALRSRLEAQAGWQPGQ
jgi:hypothetical protein